MVCCCKRRSRWASRKWVLKLAQVLSLGCLLHHNLHSSKNMPVLNTMVYAVLTIWVGVKGWPPASANSIHSSIWSMSNSKGVFGSHAVLSFW